MFKLFIRRPILSAVISVIIVCLGGLALGRIPALKMILGSMSNDIYMQIALIMLMGLLAKNAI